MVTLLFLSRQQQIMMTMILLHRLPNNTTPTELMEFYGESITSHRLYKFIQKRSTAPEDWDVVNVTIIDGDQAGGVVHFSNVGGSNHKGHKKIVVYAD